MSSQKLLIDIVSPATPSLVQDYKIYFDLLSKNNLDYNNFNFEELTVTSPIDNFFSTIPANVRFNNFKNAVENHKSKILWCSRGGYGSADLLPFLYNLPIPAKKKILIGFSDIVAISSFIQAKWGWQIICAPMLHQIIKNKVSQQSQIAIFDLILGNINEINYDLKLLSGQPQNLNSTIVGGCLSVLINNFCTKNQLDWRDKILFLEDEGEDGERLDRYFTQIAYMINENKLFPQAILLGNFYNNNEFGKVKKEKIDFAINNFTKKINLPIWQEKTFSLGHSFNQLPLILGCPTTISKDGLLFQKIDLSFF
jgi:muramoyltetrapeptide carboxypeptidase